nr:TPA_asm: hypothetical protein HUJ06_024549 [Nelumbo nucifera]
MSCPHVSGLAALLKSVHRDWSPSAIKSALMTTAYMLNDKFTPIRDVVAGSSSSSDLSIPFAFGSGHVNPERASDLGLIYDIGIEDYLNYLCSLNYTSSQMAVVARRSFTCPPTNQFLQPGDMNYPSFALLSDNGAIMLTYKRTVTNVGAPRARSRAARVGFILYNKTPPANLTSPGVLLPALPRSCITSSVGRTSLA